MWDFTILLTFEAKEADPPLVQSRVGVGATPLPVDVWISAAFKGDNDVELEMRICGDILQNTGHLVIRSTVYIHVDVFPIGSSLPKYFLAIDSVRIIE